MHVLQPTHTKLKPNEVENLLAEFNISLAQLPKIHINDPALPKDSEIGDVIKIERAFEGKKTFYYRVVSL